MQIAVIGSGISGLLTARLLASRHHVCLYEAGPTLGGHTCTIDVELAGQSFAVDTGFMVFNQRTYPNFCRLLDLIGIDSQPSDMSFSVRCDRTGLEYEGSSLNGLFAQRRNFLRPRFYRLLADILHFNRVAIAAQGKLSDEQSLGEFVRAHRLGSDFVEQYLVPMGAAIWSTQPSRMLEFPARFTLAFMHNHGLLQVRDRPVWRTIPGGARRYAMRLAADIQEVQLASPIRQVTRHNQGVLVSAANADPRTFDHVVLGCHSDQALRILADSSADEREVLSAIPYQTNEVIVHTDISLLPRTRRAWASWNYLTPQVDGEQATADVAVTYDLSRLQNVKSPTPILATLNSPLEIAPQKVLRRLEFQHPVFSRASAVAQARWAEINGPRRTWFCGAYWGHGFHEDGVRSALAVAKEFGVSLEACTAACMKEPSGTVAIAR
ncbi:NAD(P)/FAD-dependent oxidoreductase [Anatilimnocola sp. NA78]|uniref:NAD(P)/FAD-dependent oxidoreductase n=1 Tax=Anatilimnocola sp. NA78 TaxID=3415683 RepID=UPI003CE55696